LNWVALIDADTGRFLPPPTLASEVTAAVLAGAAEPSPADAITCARRKHRICLRDGQLHAPDHPADDLNRQLALAALGGSRTGCVKVIHNWELGQKLPGNLRRLRDTAWDCARNGDAPALLRLIAAGLPADLALKGQPIGQFANRCAATAPELADELGRYFPGAERV
jgi:hypothetical protein